MEKNNDNDNKNDSKLSTSKATESVETVEKPKKQKRKFEWTPKRKAAFEKCVAARKNQIQPKLKTIKEEDDSSVSSANSSLSSSSEEYKKPKRKGLKKQFYRLKKDLIYNMKKHLKKRNDYDDDDTFDLPDYHTPRYTYTSSTSRPISEQPKQEQHQQQSQQEEEKAARPKYCFV